MVALLLMAHYVDGVRLLKDAVVHVFRAHFQPARAILFHLEQVVDEDVHAHEACRCRHVYVVAFFLPRAELGN